MEKRFGSLRRIVRGISGPKKTTIQKITLGFLRKRAKNKKGPDIRRIESHLEQKYCNDSKLMKKIAQTTLYDVLSRKNEKELQAISRIAVKYSLDALNVSGKKRTEIFRQVENMREFFKSDGTKGDFEDAAFQISLALGSDWKYYLFARLLVSKSRKLKRLI